MRSRETLLAQVPSITNVEAKCNCKFSLTWPYLDDCGEFYLGLMAAKWVLMTLTRHLLKYTQRCQENWKIFI